jgi:pyrroloquinoline quinone biosynthesis protein D
VIDRGGDAGSRAGDERVPALESKARMRFDAVRGKHVLLLPERAVLLSPTAAEILDLCDGTRTVGGIVDMLQRRYPAASLVADVTEFLATAAGRGWITWTRCA